MKKIICVLCLCSLSFAAWSQAAQVICGPNNVVQSVNLVMRDMSDLQGQSPILIFNRKVQESSLIQVEQDRSGLKSMTIEANVGTARQRSYQFKNLNSKSCFAGRGVKEAAVATVDIINSYGVIASFACRCL